MATKTTNYDLIKPAGTDTADITDINDNMNALDEILKPTISDATAPPTTATSGLLATVLGWIANRIKAITGKSSWKTAPAVTLEDCNNHIGKGGEAHPIVNAQNNAGFISWPDYLLLKYATSEPAVGYIMRRDTQGRCKINTPITNNDIANKAYVDSKIAEVVAMIQGGQQ